MTKFIREIPEANIDQKQIDNLTNFGFTLIWKDDSLEVWYIDETKPFMEVLK